MKNNERDEHDELTAAGQFQLHGQSEAELQAERDDAAVRDVIMDEEDVERRAYIEASVKLLASMKGVFASIYAFEGQKMFALECAIMALGFGPQILNVHDFTQLAKRWKCTKENVRKLVEQIQRDNQLPKIEGQRSVAGCKSMSEARGKQLNRG